MYGDPIWDKTFKERNWGQYPNEESSRFYMRRGKLKDNPLCLDIGCGAGAQVWMMNREGGHVIAFDGSETALDLTGQTVSLFNNEISVNFILGDITKPKEYFTHQFDIMLDNYSLYANEKESIIEAYKQYYDLLKPGGHFLTNCFGELTDYDVLIGTSTLFTQSELKKLFAEIGYKIDYTETKLEERDGLIIEKLIFCLTR